MKHFYLIMLLCFIQSSLKAQVIIDGKDINKENIDNFEVYLLTKPFNSQESIGANIGSNNFRLHFYDLKRQAIYDADGKKFEKGEYLRLFNYLKSQGWEFENERNISYQNGRVIIFKRKSKTAESKYNGIDFCSKIRKSVDKFTDKVSFFSPGDAISLYKFESDIYLVLTTYSQNLNSSASGVILLLDDKTKITFTEKIDVKYDKDGYYEYRALIKLSQNNIVRLKSNRITDFRLYLYDKTVDIDDPYQEYLKCMDNL